MAVLQQGGQPVTTDLYYRVYEAKKDLEGKRRQVADSYDARPLFKLPTGRYYVVAGHGNAHADAEVEVTAGKLQELTIKVGKP